MAQSAAARRHPLLSRMADLPQVVVVMALPAESAGVFEAAGVPVLYCGVGKVNAAIALTRELRRYVHAGQPLPLVLNFGSAGSRVHVTGSLLACHEFVQRDMDVSGLGFALGVTPFDRRSAAPDLRAALCAVDGRDMRQRRFVRDERLRSGMRGGRHGSLCACEGVLARARAVRLRQIRDATAPITPPGHIGGATCTRPPRSS